MTQIKGKVWYCNGHELGYFSNSTYRLFRSGISACVLRYHRGSQLTICNDRQLPSRNALWCCGAAAAVTVAVEVAVMAAAVTVAVEVAVMAAVVWWPPCDLTSRCARSLGTVLSHGSHEDGSFVN